jgi:acyl-coenzyme A synthetase/AMP-(fatty) acid ligase
MSLKEKFLVVRNDNIENFIIDLLAGDGRVHEMFLIPSGGIVPNLENNQFRFRGNQNLSGDISTSWVMQTSGTTGEPKLIPHSFYDLSSTTKRSKECGSKFIWGLLYDPARYAGLQVVLQALLGGGTLVAPDLRESVYKQIEFLLNNKVNSISATPSYWRKLLMCDLLEKLELTHITLGGEIADQSILSALHKKFPLAKVRHIYASTDIGVGFSVGDLKEGFPIEYLNDGVLDGISLRINQSNHLMVSRVQKNENQSAYKYFDTNDLVKVEDARIKFYGRANGIINIGGNKVTPEFIESILYQHPLVIFSKVFGKKNPLVGNLIVAQVQIRENVDEVLILRELSELCASSLERWQRPFTFEIVNQINLSGGGKVMRHAE